MPEESNIFLKAYLNSVSGPNELEALQFRLNEPNTRDLKQINEGGAKKIYLTYAPHEEREVVIAMPKSEDLQISFIREAEIHSRLEHSNIIPLYTLGMLDESPFFSMKYVRGSSLSEYAKEHLKDAINTPLVFDQVLDFFLKVCEAVHYAHSKNILHLDIKPDNILISQGGEVYLSDWGLARYRHENVDSDTPTENRVPTGQFTYYGYLNGTPGFMAPEQCIKGAQKTEATDIYALGALLIFLLTGSPPVKGNPEAMIESTKNGTLSYNDALIPQRLRSLTKKLLQKQPSLRHQSVADIIDDIHAFRSGKLTSADDRTTVQLIRSIYHRNKTTTWSIAVAVSLVCTLTPLSFFRINQAKEEAILANEEMNQAQNRRLQIEQINQRHRLEMADRFIHASNEYNSRPDRGYTKSLFRDIEIAYQQICLALELNPNNKQAWYIRGGLEMLTMRQEGACNSLKKAGPKHAKLLEICQKFSTKNLNNDTILLKLMGAIYRDARDARLFHDLSHKRIFTQKTIKEDIDWAIKALEIRSIKTGKIHYRFDPSTMSLDLSDNHDLWVLFTLKNIPLKELILENSMVNTDLRHLVNMPLLKLNLSKCPVESKSLSSLQGKALQELNLSHTQVDNLDFIKDMPLETLHIQHSPISDLAPLITLKHLKVLYCDQAQFETLTQQPLPNAPQFIVL